MTPAEEWAVLRARINDLAVRAFRKALTCYEKTNAGFGAGEAVAIKEQLDAAEKLAEDIHKFLVAQVEAARAKPNGKEKQ